MMATLLWSATIGLFRSIAEIFGPVGGPAMVFTLGSLCAACLVGWPGLRSLPRSYLWGGGLLFVSYEIALALSIGLAHNRLQVLELGMINYLWPGLTVMFAVITRQQRSSWSIWPAMALCFLGIVWVMKGDSPWSAELLWHNLQDNPLAYGLAFCAAFLWAIYSVFTRRYGQGHNPVPLFLLATALLLWCQYGFSSAPALPLNNLNGLLQVGVAGVLMGAAYPCWNHGIQHGNLTVLAIMSYFTPVLSVLLASLWLEITPGTSFIQGVIMVTVGSLLSWWSIRQQLPKR